MLDDMRTCRIVLAWIRDNRGRVFTITQLLDALGLCHHYATRRTVGTFVRYAGCRSLGHTTHEGVNGRFYEAADVCDLPPARDWKCTDAPVPVGRDLIASDHVPVASVFCSGLPTTRVPAGSPPPEDQVALCTRWLTLFARASRREIRRRHSYHLKHRVEHWLRNIDYEVPYVCNGAFIVAALRAGFRARRTHDNSPNAYFNCTIVEV